MTKINVNTHNVADFKIERFIRNTKALRVSVSQNNGLVGGISLIRSGRELKFNLSGPNPGRRKKNKLNCYFHTSLWCLKRFYEGRKRRGTTKKCENKNLS